MTTLTTKPNYSLLKDVIGIIVDLTLKAVLLSTCSEHIVH